MGDDDETGAPFVNPINLMPKNDYVKLLIDARYLDSLTHLTNYSWHSEPVQTIMTKVNGMSFSVSAYHQVPLSPETQKVIRLIIGGKHYTYTRQFYGFCGLPNFFSRLMTIRHNNAVEAQEREVRSSQRIPSSKGWSEGSSRQSILLPKES